MTRTGPRSSTQSKTGSAPPVHDAITLLTQDHREVEKMFSEFEKLGDNAKVGKKKLADQICAELNKHMKVEEEIFYPTVQEKVKGSGDLVREAIVEHSSARKIVQELEKMKGDEELFDAKVLVLKELIEHHVEEEEDELFPKVRKSSLDLDDLGEKISERKQNL